MGRNGFTFFAPFVKSLASRKEEDARKVRSLDKAWSDGYRATLSSFGRDNNPYPVSSDEYREWRKGYDAGEDDSLRERQC